MDVDLHQGLPDSHKNICKSTVPSRQGNLTKQDRLCCTLMLMTTPKILLISSVIPMLGMGPGLGDLALLLPRQFCAVCSRTKPGLKDMFESAAESSFHAEPFITLNNPTANLGVGIPMLVSK